MGCNNCNENEEEIIIPDAECPEELEEISVPYCVSNKGKFFDKLTMPFTVPKVGAVGSMYVCEADLWSACQWVGVCWKGKYYFFKILETGEKVLKVLNGCSKGDSEAPISGNPEPGTEIDEGAVIFPTPPQGCSDQMSSRISELIENYGCPAVVKCLEEQETVCWQNLLEQEDPEELNILGVLKDDCDCAPEGTFKERCMRWLGKIFTGLGGKTLCFPNVTSTSEEDVVVDGITKSKYYAYIDENNCIRKGAKAKSGCESVENLPDDENEEFNYIMACKEGNNVKIPASCDLEIQSCCDEDNENPVYKLVKKSNKEYLLDPDDWQEFNPATPGTEDLTLEKVDDYKICGNYPKFAIVRVYGATVANSGNPGVSSLTAKLGDPLKEVFFGYSVLGSWSGGWAEHRVRLTDNGKLKLESSVYGSDAGRSLKIIVIGFVV